MDIIFNMVCEMGLDWVRFYIPATGKLGIDLFALAGYYVPAPEKTSCTVFLMVIKGIPSIDPSHNRGPVFGYRYLDKKMILVGHNNPRIYVHCFLAGIC